MLTMAFIFGANAQQNSSATDDATKPFYKFYKGSVATELNFSFFNINLTDDGISTGSFSMPELRLRFGLSDKWALRVNLGVDFGHNKIQKDLEDTYESSYLKREVTGERTEKSNYTTFSIAPGFEYHFGKWERMSVYVGCEIPFGIYMTRSTFDENITTKRWERINYYEDELIFMGTVESTSSLEAKNVSDTYVCDPWGCYYEYGQSGKMFFGINAFAGFDFYVYKGLYVGAELGLGYRHAMALKGSVKGEIETIVTSATGSSTTTNTEIDEKFQDKITGGHLGFKCNPMIRLGWRF